MTKTTRRLTPARPDPLVSGGITTMTEARFGRELIRNIRVQDETGAVTAEHVILETTGRHRRLKLRARADDSAADAILELRS